MKHVPSSPPVATKPCARVFRDPVHFLALGFGSGCAPKAPGTFGTLAAIPLYLLAQPLPLWAYLLLTRRWLRARRLVVRPNHPRSGRS
jgi:phosphatidylglycerophosphatase A